MSEKSSCHQIASGMALLTQALLLLLLSASILGAGDLEANEYGEIDETPVVTQPVTEGGAAILSADSEGAMADEVATSESTEPENVSVFSDETVPSDEELVETNTSEMAVSAEEEIEEEEEETEPTMAEAVVYVFNNDDDTLSISLFIDSELLGTEDVSKEKEKKFGNYPVEAGSHNFKITWWDDDTKKTYQEEQEMTIEDVTAVTLYATQNKEPEEFEVNVMLRNDNTEDLEAYLYIDGEYEKQKTAKKESTTDFGKFDLEEGNHELAVRWQDPETNIDYEKRKTIRVDGTDVITFYAPKGMTFESNEVTAPKTTTSKTTTTKTTTSSKTDTTSTSTTKKDTEEEVESPSTTGTSNSNKQLQTSDEVKSTTNKAMEPEPDESNLNDGPDATNVTLCLSTIGTILAIYFIFFRR